MNQLDQNTDIDKIVAIWNTFLDKEVFYVPALGFIYPSGNLV